MQNTSLNTLAWQKLKQNRLAFSALIFIVFCVFIGIFAVVLSPDDSPMANQMHIELATKKPLTKITFLEIKAEIPLEIKVVHRTTENNNIDVIKSDALY